jgi:DNA-binding response OmpR family regulator
MRPYRGLASDVKISEVGDPAGADILDRSDMARRILIVEDDLTLANLMAAVLADAGYEPEVATSPGQARGTYDLVVSDYLAPVFAPGQPWPHLDELRALSRGGPILGCTGHQDALADEPEALGISAVAAKPFDVDDLLRRVEELLEQGAKMAQASPLARPASTTA